MTEIKDRGCWIFRTNYDIREQIFEELEQGCLRQGWGGKGLSLLDASGQERSKEAWNKAYQAAWDEEPSKRRYSILHKMHGMATGDWLVLPKLPNWDTFTLCEVAGGYRFEEDAFFQRHNDFGHIIPIKPETIKQFSKLSSTETAQIQGYFRKPFCWSAIADLSGDEVFKSWVAAQAEKPSDLEGKKPELMAKERAYNSRKVAAAALIEDAGKNWEPSQFEKAVKHAFEQKGYAHVGSNSYDGKGADADHIFLPPLPGLSMEDGTIIKNPLILVQVKHKKGTDYGDTAGVEQLVKWNPPEENEEEVFMRILFSSADEPTLACKKLAEEHGVVLMFGVEAGLFLL